jgi:hypothetical protein
MRDSSLADSLRMTRRKNGGPLTDDRRQRIDDRKIKRQEDCNQIRIPPEHP